MLIGLHNLSYLAFSASSSRSLLGVVSVPGVVVVGLVIGTALCVWAAMMWRRTIVCQRGLTERNSELKVLLQDLRDESRLTLSERDQAQDILLQHKSKLDMLKHRSRTLEKILAVSARINATRNLSELLERVAGAVDEIIGFRKVVLHLWSDETKTFEARAFSGIPERKKAALIGIQVKIQEYNELAHVRNRYSNCYLCSASASQDEDLDDLSRQNNLMVANCDWQDDQILIAPLITAAGEVKGYISLDEPVSGLVPGIVEIRQLEFLVQQATTALDSLEVYNHLAKNNAELTLASEKLATLSDMKANFVANVSHELRTPLTSISAYTELLQQNMDTMSEDAKSEFLKVINSESSKLTGVINDILELGAINNGQITVNQTETDMVVLINRMEESWRSRAQDRNIRLVLKTSAPEIHMQIDSILFQQLLGHLLSNAFKFTPEGGRVIISIQETGTAVRLTIEDTGIGIPDGKLGEIFDQFYQVDGSATREHNGQGVGLAICHDIVSHHDGRIWAENLEPSGARFTVLLPRRPAVLQEACPQNTSGFSFDASELMPRLMHWICERMGVKVISLMVPDANEEFLTVKSAIGLSEAVVQSTRVRKGTGLSGKVWANGQTLLVNDIIADDRLKQEESEPRYDTPSLLIVPLFDEHELVGIISVNNRLDKKPLDDDDRLLLESLAPRLAALLKRFRVWRDGASDFQNTIDTLRATTAVGRLRQESLVEVCQEICLAAARKIMLPPDEMEHLAFALQFYDVGLSRIPPQLLNKPGPLDRHEERFVQKHVSSSLDILEPLNIDSKVKQLILHHHENFNGTGYPTGLAGEAIPLGARLIRLADTMAAMLSQRPWRPAFTIDQALAEIRSGSGRFYCPRMTDVFLAETAIRRNRIVDLQRKGVDGHELNRPILDRQGMMSILK